MMTARPNDANIPGELKQLDQWVCWSAVKRGNKVTKVPKNPRTGGNASSTDHNSWSDFRTALDACGKFDGVGFVFASDRKIVGLDLDHVLTDDGTGKPVIADDEIRRLVGRADTYTEVSPSGSGLHLFFRGSMPDGSGRHKHVRSDGVGIEMYDNARFFTVTGNSYGIPKPLNGDLSALAFVRDAWLKPADRKDKTAGRAPAETPDFPHSDGEIIELMENSANGDGISRLLHGDTSAYNGDDSAAALALLNHLVFWCDGDRGQIERIFRSSGIDADKLDSKRGDSTWLQQQIDVALRDFTGDTYGSAKKGTSGTGRPKQPEGKSSHRGRFDHYAAAQILVRDNGACFIDGVPATCKDGRYNVGIRAIESELVGMYPKSTRNNRAETLATLDFLAPHIGQSDVNLIAFENGVLDPRTMELHPFSHDLVIPNVIPHQWNPEARCDAVDQTLRNMADGNSETFSNLCEAAGIAMSRRIEPPYIFCLLGYGSNGKSLFFKMLTRLLGDRNISRLEPQDFGKRFQTASVMGKLANVYDDASSDRLDKETCAQMKNISNGSGTRSDVKGKDPIEFQPYATLLFSFNSFPTCADTSHGFMRRLVPIDFTATFKPGTANYDPHIVEKVTSEAAMQRFAVLAVCGLNRVIDRGSLTDNARAEAIKGDIRTANNTVLQWLQSTGYGAADFIGRSSEEAFSMYESWCDTHHRQLRSQIGFSRTITREFGLSTASQRMKSGQWRKVYERKHC